MTRATPSIRAMLRALAWACALAAAISTLAACGQRSGEQAAPAATDAGLVRAAPAAVAPAAPATVPAPTQAIQTPASSTVPTTTSGETAEAGVQLGGIALADATAAAGPVSNGARRRRSTADQLAIGKVDNRCNTAADCAVKDVGSCCGYRPQCVNRDSETRPEAVKANCASEARAGICGFPMIESCECVQGHCAALPPSNNGLVQ